MADTPASEGAPRAPSSPFNPSFVDYPNQPPLYQDRDLLGEDAALHDAASALLGPAELDALGLTGRSWGSAARLEEARLADQNPPQLVSHDARGERIDRVDYHPAYHALLARSMSDGLHVSAEPGAPLAAYRRAAHLHLVAQTEAGHLCPIVMTHAAPAALAEQPDLAGRWLPRIARAHYDPRELPSSAKDGVTIGMGMTERQGGSDLRTAMTRAEPVSEGWLITGSKWFLSAPMSDAFIVLAQAPAGPTAFLVPRRREDGARNGIRLVRLKDKLGNRSNASAEAEFDGALGAQVGEEGRGVATLLKMVGATRIDCAVASAGLMRAALARAMNFVRHRRAFGAALVDQPAMRAVLADLALEVEGATALVMRLSLALDRAGRDLGEGTLVRFGASAAKYLVCKTAPALVYEAMECLGGNGYVEESGMPRLFREAPVNAIWEGSGNVLALDVRRAAQRDPEMTRELVAAIADVARGLPGVAGAASAAIGDLTDLDGESRARRGAELLGRLIAVAALVELAPRPVAEAYARLRLTGRAQGTFGASGAMLPEALLIERALRA